MTHDMLSVNVNRCLL